MSRKQKKSKAVPIVLVIFLLFAAIAAGLFLVRPMLLDPIEQTAKAEFDRTTAEVQQRNQDIMAEYRATILELENSKDEERKRQ